MFREGLSQVQRQKSLLLCKEVRLHLQLTDYKHCSSSLERLVVHMCKL